MVALMISAQKEKDQKPIEWDDYFVEYEPISEDGKTILKKDGSSKKKTWYRLRALEHLKGETGYITVYGYVPKDTQEFPDYLYKALYGNSPNHKELQTLKVKVPRGQIFHYRERHWIFSKYKINRNRYWREAFSLVTVPVKIRPSHGNIGRLTTSGISNLGVYWSWADRKWNRFYVSGKKFSAKLSFGGYLAPSVENVKGNQRRSTFEIIPDDSNELFVSTGLAVSLAINDINFIFIPMGFDFATSSVGKDWAFNRKRWWGFGIGIETKALGAIFSK